MEFNLSAGDRNLFYLAFLFFGAAVGFILNHFKKKSTTRRRNRSLTLAYCCFSIVVAALTAAFILSHGAVFFEKSFYLPAGVILILVVLAVRFPKAIGFPLILLGGFAAVWSFFAFPLPFISP
jgi:hypothetical protein